MYINWEAIINWIGNYASFVQFVVQNLFWVIIALCAISASLSFRRYVRDRRKADRFLTEMYERSEYDDYAVPEQPKSAQKSSDISVDAFID